MATFSGLIGTYICNNYNTAREAHWLDIGLV